MSDPLEDGSEQHPYDGIQEGIDAASNGDTVLVKESMDEGYRGTGNRDLDFGGKAITVKSEHGQDRCTINCEDAGRAFYFHTGETATSVVEGFTIYDGRGSNDEGAGILCENSSPTVRNCIFSWNSGQKGGGMYNDASSPTVADCTFHLNSVGAWGAGMCNVNASNPMVANCVFKGNIATRGGAMYNWDSSPTVIDCEFVRDDDQNENAARIAGGAMYNRGGSPIVVNCTFDSNEATNALWLDSFGGAVYNDESSPTVSNCTFTNNYALDDGGAMYNSQSTPTLGNCTFHGNYVDDDGGAMYNGASSVPTLANCTFSANTAWDKAGAMYNSASSPTMTNCTFGGNKARDDGGAMYNGATSEPIVTNCTFSANISSMFGSGGAMHNTGSGPTVTNCTFSANRALPGNGGAMYNSDSSPTLANCIFWDNCDSSGCSDESSQIYGGAPVLTYSCIQGCTTFCSDPDDHNIGADPLFVNPDGPDNDPNAVEDNDYRLSATSPCIDAADNTEVPPDIFDLDADGDTGEPTPFDLDRRLRFVERILTEDTGNPDPNYPELEIVDMGAYEYQCTGDIYDGNGKVDLSDLAELLSNYRMTSGAMYPDGDVDPQPNGIDPVGDGDVDLRDLAALLANYGNCAGRGRGDGGDGESRGEDGGRGEGEFMRVFIEPYDTGGYQGGGFHGEVDHFVFDLKIEVFDPNDDWTTAGALLDAHNDATFRLSSGPLVPDAYATFVAAPWVEVPGSPNGASIAGAYLPADPTYEFESTGINIAWFDTQDSHDGPATVLRLVIDVSAVEGADVSGGFGSVYFSYWSPAEPGDILVADLRSAATSASGGGELVPLNGRFYVKGE